MRHHRQGYSLVECLVAITLTGTALGVVSVTMHGLHRADRRGRDRLESVHELQRFARLWRRDVHQARAIEVHPGPHANRQTLLRLPSSPGNAIEYTLDTAGITRVVTTDGAPSHRDSFRLRLDPNVEWQVDRDGDLPLASLALRWQSADINHLPIDRLVAAAQLRSILARPRE
ncbi:MAG: type II secretion system protein J [Pirellulaceae bacterium]